MIDLQKTAGLIFDYGATIDSNGKHWAEVLWDAYLGQHIPIKKETFREAYVYGERYLALHPVVKPEFTFREVLYTKVNLQFAWLTNNGYWPDDEKKTLQSVLDISNHSYNFAYSAIENAKPILSLLSEKYRMVVVSNFYGNIQTVLEEFGLTSFFAAVIESAVVGVRKPDPAIFDLGVKALSLSPGQVVVIGDSYKKDIVPAQTLGCQTIWLKGPAWEEDAPGSTADVIITDFTSLKKVFLNEE